MLSCEWPPNLIGSGRPRRPERWRVSPKPYSQTCQDAHDALDRRPSTVEDGAMRFQKVLVARHTVKLTPGTAADKRMFPVGTGCVILPKMFTQGTQQVDLVGKGRCDRSDSSWKRLLVFSRRNLLLSAMSIDLCTPQILPQSGADQ
jgi:hypothetical protein